MARRAVAAVVERAAADGVEYRQAKIELPSASEGGHRTLGCRTD